VDCVADVVLLSADVMSRMNGERMRIHYPKDLANSVLRSDTEPIMRKSYRAKAKEVAQELRDAKAVTGSFFPRGGRGFIKDDRRRSVRKQTRPNFGSFPHQNSGFNKFSKFRRPQRFQQRQTPKTGGSPGTK
jgi:hypothetical protein